MSTTIAPHVAPGTYVNALEADASIADAYEGDILARLVDVKRRYDPEGVFSANGIAAGGA
jgi:FAD/FMN-containing dehydrogenase